ncbi:hypothetical protein ACLB2K_055192 [Fragaria x ananassa]
MSEASPQQKSRKITHTSSSSAMIRETYYRRGGRGRGRRGRGRNLGRSFLMEDDSAIQRRERRNSNNLQILECSSSVRLSQINPDYTVSEGAISTKSTIDGDIMMGETTSSGGSGWPTTAARVSWLYGPSRDIEKEVFWNNISDMGCDQDMPWICVGDLNEVLWPHEKLGGNAWVSNQGRFLRNFMNSNELSDLGFKGQKFTWKSHWETDDGHIYERLDRGLANARWLECWPNTTVFHGTRIGSDHCPLLVDTEPYMGIGPKLFKFEASWIREDACAQILNRCWEAHGDGNAFTQWVTKLDRCKESLSRWRKSVGGNNRKLINKCLSDLESLQIEGTEEVDHNAVRELTNTLSDLWSSEELYWKQRSRVNWLKNGDSNTRFFHLSTIQRRQANQIQRLKNDQDLWVEEESGLRMEVESYFHNLFTSVGNRNWSSILEQIPSSVSLEMNEELIKRIDIEEVKAAAFQLGDFKAPGPDGFGGLFYHNFWETVHSTVNSAAMSMWNVGDQLAELNHTNIVLIPKIPNQESVSQFRPISLCNFSYKILSKVLANRLKVWLPDLISHHQSAFVPGRQIQDNVLVAHEVFHYLKLQKLKKRFELALKLDMNKAYDRVEWDFLEKVMLKMGFCTRWVELIMRCVRTVSFSVSMNGKVGSPFRPSRGLRQGDPLSPYLFLFVTEVLSYLLVSRCEQGELHGIQISPNGPGITHLFFADDSLFFLKADEVNCLRLKSILDEYCLASGQSINYDKSSLFFSPNTPGALRENINMILQINDTPNPGKYLGLPTIWGRSKKEAFGFIRSRLQSKLQGWKQNQLSLAGKMVLIKSVAFAIPTYPMNCFKLPVTLCREFDSLVANFW